MFLTLLLFPSLLIFLSSYLQLCPFTKNRNCHLNLFFFSVATLNRLGFIDSADLILSVRTAIEEHSFSKNVLPPYNPNSEEVKEECKRKEYVQQRTYEELKEEMHGLNNAGKKKVKRRATNWVTGEAYGIHGPPGDYSK